QSVVLTATGDGTFAWKPGTGLSDSLTGNPVASPHDTTVYQVTVTNSYGCKDSALVIVYVYINPVANAGPNKTIVKGDSVLLNGFVDGTHINYFWTPTSFMGNSKIVTPLVSPPSDQLFTLTAQSTLGCGTASSSVMVKVYNDIFIPNTFSPNNDGKNDIFRIVAADGYRLLKFQVFNRWGQLIFNSNDLGKGWNGMYNTIPQPEDTYVYIVELESAYGRIINKKGTITLIR
ncbi:MAG: gliding motility-associated C-terminal domain-containing protein, partial [Flavisolibacter sp.]